MIAQIVAAVQTIESTPTMSPRSILMSFLPCIMLLVVICFWGLVIFGLIKLIKYLGSAGREQKLIRMELSKLADEVQQIRRELKGGTEQKENTN